MRAHVYIPMPTRTTHRHIPTHIAHGQQTHALTHSTHQIHATHAHTHDTHTCRHSCMCMCRYTCPHTRHITALTQMHMLTHSTFTYTHNTGMHGHMAHIQQSHAHGDTRHTQHRHTCSHSTCTHSWHTQHRCTRPHTTHTYTHAQASLVQMISKPPPGSHLCPSSCWGNTGDPNVGDPACHKPLR